MKNICEHIEEVVQSNLVSNAIILKYVSRVQLDGKDIVNTVKFGNVKTSESDDGVGVITRDTDSNLNKFIFDGNQRVRVADIFLD